MRAAQQGQASAPLLTQVPSQSMNVRWLIKTVLCGTIALNTPLLYGDVSGNDLPDFGDSSGSLISPAQEMALGKAFMRSIRAQTKLVTDPDIAGYITRLGQRLVANSDTPSYPFTFFVVDNTAVNAFAGPGGYIGIHTGLILTAESESELAGVVAHEIAHVTQRHLLRAYESAQKMSLPTAAAMIAGILLGVAADSPQAGIAAVSAVQAGSIQRQLNFTRANEKEADRIGIQTLSRSGIDPYGMPSFFERLYQSTRLYGNNVPEFLSTHPVTTSRIAESLSRAERYGRSKERTSLEFQLVRARLQVLNSSKPQAALNIFKTRAKKQSAGPADHYGLALAYWHNEDYAAAKKQLQTLLDDDPDRKIYRISMARLELDSGQTDAALRRFRDTLKLYPGDRIVGQYYISALIQSGQAAEARDQAVKMLRNKQAHSPEMYELWAKAASVAGPAWETNIASGEVYFLYGNLRFAIDQLERALQHKGLSQYERARVEARLTEFKQLQAEREHE
ncbi:Exported zinc metalloprotease YfgC precursor [hydrothermal vent metagenome]|uniref:Exported zinc metalloprotease YfgC n=1 Tax=hydrothermal vent metagenome TaxID=652676 RepID=A0A3B0YZW5_9ZZZZ